MKTSTLILSGDNVEDIIKRLKLYYPTNTYIYIKPICDSMYTCIVNYIDCEECKCLKSSEGSTFYFSTATKEGGN